MYRIYSAVIEIMAAAVFIIPVWCVYNKLYFHSWRRTLVYIIFGFYLTAVLALTGFPNIKFLRLDAEINIIPFVYMIPDFANACLNVLLFVPFGFFLPVLWSPFRTLRRAASAGLAASCMIEASQIFTFRTTDINDLITNTAGAIIGYFFARLITKNFAQRVLSDSKVSDFYIICISVAVIMFFFQPFISSL